jgi:hypothetical protein
MENRFNKVLLPANAQRLTRLFAAVIGYGILAAIDLASFKTGAIPMPR